MTPSEEAGWKRLRTKFLLRNLPPIAGAVIVCPYVLGVLFKLKPEETRVALLYVVPAVVLVHAIAQQWAVSGWLCRRALAVRPEDPPGARLERLLRLPRHLELYCLAPAYSLGGFTFAVACCAQFNRSVALVPIGVVVSLALALLVGIPITLTFQADVLPLALQEHARSPKASLSRTGFSWPRQSWYLPYTFAVLMFLVLVYSGIILGAKLGEGHDELLRQLATRVDPSVVELARESTNAMLGSIAPPVLLIASVLLIFFMVSGWLMGQLERRAAKAIEESLSALVSGNPIPPGWIGTTEVGDVAFAVANISDEMREVFQQLRSMAEGSLSIQLEGNSGLINAFRSSQRALLQIADQMRVLARGDIVANEEVFGDLGKTFGELSGALGATISQAKTIAKGDLRTDPMVTGELGSAIHQMTENLRSMVGQTQEVGAKISDIVVSLRSASAQLSTATTEQVSALAETANTMTEMSQTSAASADRCADLIRQGESAAAVVDKGRSGASDAGRAMNAISASLGKVASLSGALSEKVQQVDGIIETVGFLADQSSTLAINAGIEASRAGEAGKGFAAVAREMRALASDSRKATAQIREILQEIRQKTVQVDSSVAAGSSTIEDGVRLVNQLGDAIGQLGVTIHDAVGLMRQVEGSARQHQAGVGQVSQALRSMQSASESIRDGARLLSGLSEQAHSLATMLKHTSGAYQLPAKPVALALNAGPTLSTRP